MICGLGVWSPDLCGGISEFCGFRVVEVEGLTELCVKDGGPGYVSEFCSYDAEYTIYGQKKGILGLENHRLMSN